jgi:hypothetical protein
MKEMQILRKKNFNFKQKKNFEPRIPLLYTQVGAK